MGFDRADADGVERTGRVAGPAGRRPDAAVAARPATAPDRTAAEICRNLPLGARARKLLAEGMKPGQFLTLLVEHQLHADAIRYMAHAMLNREAVWWACLCTRSRAEALETLPPAQRQALGAAVRWVLEPTDDHRREAGRSAEAAGIRTPAGALAKAAAFALGQPEPPDPGATPPNPALAARLAAASILLEAKTAARLRRFITLGLDVAYHHNRWD